MSRPAPEAVKAALALSASALAEALIPDGRIDGGRWAAHQEWRGHGPDGAKWGVVIKGPKLGHWQNFGTAKGGHSLLSLIRDACCGGDHIAAYQWACDWLGGEVIATLPEAAAQDPAPPAKPAPRTTGNGARLYMAGAPMQTWDCPIGRYLEGRGISRRGFLAPLASLRFLPDCWCSEADAPLPAMLAPVVDPLTNAHLATHRTYLEQQGGAWRKAKLAKPKKVLGSFAGGVIPLISGRDLVLAEGIENTLSAAIWCPELGAAAYVAAGNIANLRLPVACAYLMLVRDRDGSNPPIAAARDRAVARWLDEGRNVDIWEPPEGVHDANDYLQRVAAGGEE